jgi:DNA-binding GntR family transcriptional regulator
MFDVKIKIDRTDRVLLHDQIARSIRHAVASGRLKPGDQLPPAVDIASSSGVNKNTVLRAVGLLRSEGVLDVRRGRRMTVVGAPERSDVLRRVRDLVDFCRTQGYRRDEIIQMIESLS